MIFASAFSMLASVHDAIFVFAADAGPIINAATTAAPTILEIIVCPS